jgi:hypothetical protein
MRRVRIHAAAAEEAVEAAAWYEQQRSGLGAEFEQAIEASLDLLEAEVVPLVPVPGTAGTRGVKRLLLRRFPYAVIVRESAVDVVVIAFAHSARRPGYWRGRVKRGL